MILFGNETYMSQKLPPFLLTSLSYKVMEHACPTNYRLFFLPPFEDEF